MYIRKRFKRSKAALSITALACHQKIYMICRQRRNSTLVTEFRLKSFYNIPTTKPIRLTWGRTLMTHWAGRWDAMRVTISHGRDSKPEGEGLVSGVPPHCRKFNLWTWFSKQETPANYLTSSEFQIKKIYKQSIIKLHWYHTTVLFLILINENITKV